MQYIVREICGDYAVIEDEVGSRINISVFLLPFDLIVGDKLQNVGLFQYEKV